MMAETTVPPEEVVVMPGETSVPGLRALLRQSGFFVPPKLARQEQGAALVRQLREHVAEQGAGDVADPYPPWREEEPEEEPPVGRAGPRAGAAPGRAGLSEEVDEHPTGAYQSSAPLPESTAQIDYHAAAALAQRMEPGVGDSTTQAAHATERMDLSEWGYLLRIVLISDGTSKPNVMLEGLRPTVGEWLRAEIEQPARLEYDRRFRRDVEKMLAKFLTDSIGRFPVVKVDIQFIG